MRLKQSGNGYWYLAEADKYKEKVGLDPDSWLRDEIVKATVAMNMNRVDELRVIQKRRDWGYNVPAEDIDFLEYDNCRPVALFEFKRRTDWQTAKISLDANLKAMKQLADMARLPLFVTVYPDSHDSFRVIAINHFAKLRLHI